jgi:hypothetical protein
LAQDLQLRAASCNDAGFYASVVKELIDYAAETQKGIEIESSNSLDFWMKQETFYTNLAPPSQDLISAPTSQTYAERVFSLCGDMCSGKTQSLQ